MSTPTEPVRNSVSLSSALVIQGAVNEVIARAYPAVTSVELLKRFDLTSVLMTVLGGERGNVIVVIDKNVDELIAAGSASERGHVPLVRTGAGVAGRAGVTKPDISTVSAFKSPRLDARSVAYSRTGASGTAALFSAAVDNNAAFSLPSMLASKDAQPEYRRFGLEIPQAPLPDFA
jgi:hypothetical protein